MILATRRTGATAPEGGKYASSCDPTCYCRALISVFSGVGSERPIADRYCRNIVLRLQRFQPCWGSGGKDIQPAPGNYLLTVDKLILSGGERELCTRLCKQADRRRACPRDKTHRLAPPYTTAAVLSSILPQRLSPQKSSISDKGTKLCDQA
jgi:hypothetical protein